MKIHGPDVSHKGVRTHPRSSAGTTAPGAPGRQNVGMALERSRAAAERARTTFEDGVDRLEQARPRVTAVDVVMSTYERDRDTGGGLLAGALSYRFFILLLPLVFLFVVGFGFVDSVDESAPADAANEFGMSGAAASAIADSAQLSSESQILAVVAGTIALLWAARGVLRAVRLIHALAWNQPQRRFRRVGPGVLTTVGIALGATVLTLGFAWLRDHIGTVGLLITIAAVVLYGALWLVASMHLPHGDVGWTALLPGAVLFGVGAQGLHLLTVLWITHKLASASAAYGALGIALVLLLWLYLLGRLVVLSAMLNATMAARNGALDGPLPAPEPPAAAMPR
jgi:uncharacterized BrkB/YihY/UPF0761 family membrane protein